MSDKEKFIRNTAALFVACHWEKPKAERAVRLAIALWGILSDCGYGDKAQAKPRESKSYYKEMSQYQKEGFDKFWKNFNYKNGRERAAMRWIELGEPPQEVYAHIIYAGSKEAEARPIKVAQGITPVMAEKWLFEMRYNDIDPASTKHAPHKSSEELRQLRADITHYSKLDDDFSKAETARLMLRMKNILAEAT